MSQVGEKPVCVVKLRDSIWRCMGVVEFDCLLFSCAVSLICVVIVWCTNRDLVARPADPQNPCWMLRTSDRIFQDRAYIVAYGKP